MRALLLLLLLLVCLCSRVSLEEEQCLNSVPLGLGHGLQTHETLGTGRNGHWGLY